MKKKLFSRITALFLCCLLALSYLTPSDSGSESDITPPASGSESDITPPDTEYPISPADDLPPKQNKN